MFFPLLLFFGLGLALAAYELSPHARSRINDYVRALQQAYAAHRAADGHLSNANRAAEVAMQHAQTAIDVRSQEAALGPGNSSTDVAARAARVAADAAIDHAMTATLANQQAAQSTADAARRAQTASERDAVAQSADRIIDRSKKIEEALASLGVGECDVRSYPGVSSQIRDKILVELHAEGMAVTGDNPWDIDPQLAGVKLRAVWDPETQILRLIVVAHIFYVACEMIWERIDPKLRGIIGS